MEWVAYKGRGFTLGVNFGPLALLSHLCPYRHSFCTFVSSYAMVFFQVLSSSSLLNIFVDHKSWPIPRALPFPPCFRKSVLFSCIFHGNSLCHLTADILLP